MNICMFTNTYLPHVGGVAKSVSLFSEDLISLGHKVLVIAPIFAEKGNGDRPEEILRVPAIQNFNGSDFSARIAVPFLISSRIKNFEPDVIHSHHPYLLGDAALRTARRYGIPLIFTHHTLYEQYTHYISMDSDQMKQFIINISTNYANLCDRVIAPSRSVGELIRERGVAVPVVEIPTGVDLGFFKRGSRKRFRNRYGIPAGEKVVGHVGRLATEKNIPFLAEAVANALKTRKGIFLVVGEGESEEEIRNTFAQCGLENRLLMTGVKSGMELVDAYSAMDMFVFTSHSETQGLVLAEAMAAGIPVVALEASGVREVVVDGKNGFLLPRDTSEAAFSHAIERLLEDQDLLQSLKKNAVRTAQAFSRKRCAERLLLIYESALAETPSQVWNSNQFAAWDKLLRAISVEWELLSEKASALVSSLTGEA